MIPGQIQLDLARLQFCLLQAEQIGIYRLKKLCKAFLHASAQTVYVP